jgi:transposase-like protein
MAKFRNHSERRAAYIPIVRSKLAEGKGVSEIAKQISVPRGTVAAWIRRNSLGTPPFDRLTPTAVLDAAVARLQGIYLEAMQSWEASKTGTTVETQVAVDENNFVRSQTANRRVTRTSHGDPAFLYAAIRALKESMRAAVIIAARPPDSSLDRLLALNEEAFARSVRSMSDEEVFELEKTVHRVAAPMITSQPRTGEAITDA